MTLGNPQLVQVARVAEAVGLSNQLDDGKKDMSLENVPCSYVVVAESVAAKEGCGWALSYKVLNCISNSS